MFMLFIISAPSGGGKTTIIRNLLKKIEFLSFSVSATTRPKRNYEKEGLDYYFVSNEKFKEMIKNNELAEWEQVHDNYYGTLKSEIENKSADSDLIFDVDVKGALKLKSYYPDAKLIFIESSIEDIRKRLIKRGTENVQQINLRLSRIKSEMLEKDKFDNVILNKNGNEGIEIATKELKEIINKYRGNKK